jgi:hypothetical protein
MLMRRMISLFQENTPRLLDDIRGSHCRASGDLVRSAHALRSFWNSSRIRRFSFR